MAAESGALPCDGNPLARTSGGARTPLAVVIYCAPGKRGQARMWLTALTGGLAGALITLGLQALGRYWNRPILKIVFQNDEPGCAVTTPGVYKDPQGNLHTVQQKYLRLKITNQGNTFAKNTSVCVTEINYGAVAFAEEVFDLKLAQTGNQAIFNLAPKGHRFVDLVHATQESGGPVTLGFDFVTGAIRLALLPFGSGQYEMKVFATAENAKSVSGGFNWSWDDTLNSLRIGAA